MGHYEEVYAQALEMKPMRYNVLMMIFKDSRCFLTNWSNFIHVLT